MTGDHSGEESASAGFSLVAVLITERLLLDSRLTSCRSGEFAFDVRVQDHSGLIDLNASDAQLLSLGFASLGFDRQTSEALAKAAIQFRGNASAFAARAESTTAVGPSENKLAPFESVPELQEFSRLASTRLHDLYAVFTVSSKRGTLSLNYAPNRLRVVLADGSGSDASVMQGATEASAYTVEITARRDGSGITGHAGFIIKSFQQARQAFGVFHEVQSRRSPTLQHRRPPEP